MTRDELQQLIRLGEGFTCEFKQSGTAHLGRELCAFANVQVYIFKDRVEIVSPGGLPAGMTEADLGRKSIPRNPLLFGMLYRMDAVEHIGSGIKRIRQICADYGVAAPEIQVEEDWFTVSFPRALILSTLEVTPEVKAQVTGQVTESVQDFLSLIKGEMSRRELQDASGLKGRDNFEKLYLKPALALGLIERSIPDKPTSRLQKYRLTEKGRKLANMDGK